jgi:hypothetical protein
MMNKLEKAAALDTRMLLDSARELRSCLRTVEAVYRRTLNSLESGNGASLTLKAAEAGRARQELTEALRYFEQCRHHARLSLIAAELEEGRSIGEIGRTWGFSRQLAAKYAKEARGGR